LVGDPKLFHRKFKIISDTLSRFLPVLFEGNGLPTFFITGDGIMKRFNQIFTKHFSSLLALGCLIFFVLGCFKSDDNWKNHLAHKKLTSAKTSGSISDRVDIYFCPSGEYAKRTDFVGNSGGFSMANEDVEYGSWTVESGTLILQSEDGKTTQYSLSQGTDNNVIKLNGTGFLVTQHDKCGN
jgi:hypothetical protein